MRYFFAVTLDEEKAERLMLPVTRFWDAFWMRSPEKQGEITCEEFPCHPGHFLSAELKNVLFGIRCISAVDILSQSRKYKAKWHAQFRHRTGMEEKTEFRKPGSIRRHFENSDAPLETPWASISGISKWNQQVESASGISKWNQRIIYFQWEGSH